MTKKSHLEREQGKVLHSAKTNYVEKRTPIGRLHKKKAMLALKLLKNTSIHKIIMPQLKVQVGITHLMKLKIKDEPTVNPTSSYSVDSETSAESVPLSDLSELLSVQKSDDFVTPYLQISDYAKAYKEKSTTPTDVAKSIIDKLENDVEIKEKLNAVIEFHKDEILESAKLSTERYANDAPLSVLDGIPFFVKEEIKISGYTINFGTTNFADGPCTENATIIQKLLDAGAILMGLTKMTLLGFGTVGFNPSPTHGHVANPHNPAYYSGGSSTGSAAVVSAGLCPFAIGVDGLGSNRIPPSITGVVGLKATYARISNGKLDHADKSYISCGPITSCVQDAAIVYGAIAGPDPDFEFGLKQPKVELAQLSLDADKIKSVKFGFDSSFTKLAMDEEVTAAVESVVESLKTLGCQVVDHCVAECAETIAAMQSVILHDQSHSVTEHFKSKISSMECANATILLAVGNEITKAEYEQACRQRTRSINVVSDMFSKFDVLITPCIGGANLLVESGDEKCGVLDDVSTSRLTRYCALASFTGIPAISINIGHKSSNGLPIAIQLQSKWWTESMLLQVAYQLEQLLLSKVHKQPKIFRKVF